MKYAVAYCRVSTDHKEQLESIEKQKEQWKQFFNKNKEIKPANAGCIFKRKEGFQSRSDGLYVDEGITGTSMKNRKAFNQMIEDAKKGQFNYIYVEDTSRFARSTEDGIKVIKDLRELGVLVYFRKEGWFCDADHDFEYTLRVSISQEESQKLSRRVQWGMSKFHESGGWNSNTPYGYDLCEGYLVVNAKEAVTVKEIYRLFLDEKWGTGKICRYLNENQIPTKKGVMWSQTQVTRILENRIYIGEQRTHTVQNDDITRKTRKIIPENEQIVLQLEQLRIIDNNTFELVQLERKSRLEKINMGVHTTSAFLFSQVCYCGNCGGVYKRKRRHAYCRKDGTKKDLGYEWTCTINDMYGKSRCDKRVAVSEDKLHHAIKRNLMERKTENLDELFELFLAKELSNKDIDIEETKQKIEIVKKQQNQLRKDLACEFIDENDYSEAMHELATEMQQYKANIERVENVEKTAHELRAKYREYQRKLSEIDIEKLSNADLKTVYNKIYIKSKIIDGKKKTFLRFEYNFMGSTDDDIIQKFYDENENIMVWFPLE